MIPIKINGAGNPISAAMGAYVTQKLQKKDQPGVRVFLPPQQMQRVRSIPNFILLLESHEKEPVNKFCGVEIVEDPHMQADEIHWRDKDNVIVAKIIGLAT